MAAARRRTASRARGAPRRGHGPRGLQGEHAAARACELGVAAAGKNKGRREKEALVGPAC
jgi:hypothetical protein